MGDLIANRRRLIAASPHLVTTQNASSVYIGEPKIERLAVTFAPEQAGSGTPSPSNVRAISGWTEISARICGKNLFDNVFPDEDATVRYRPVYVGDSQVTFSTTCGLNSAGYTVLYALPGNVSKGADTAANGLYSGNTRTVTPANGYVTLAYRAGNNNAVPSNHTTQIEVGTTATTIEPFRGITPTASLGSTYYGGTVDLVSGTMMVTHYCMDVNQTNLPIMNKYSVTKGAFVAQFQRSDNNYPLPVGLSGISNRFSQTISSGPGRINIPTLGTVIYLFIPVSEMSAETVSAAWTWFESNPTQIVYELATPQTVTLTPQTIAALRGQQTVSSPAGSVDITYWTY